MLLFTIVVTPADCITTGSRQHWAWAALQSDLLLRCVSCAAEQAALLQVLFSNGHRHQYCCSQLAPCSAVEEAAQSQHVRTARTFHEHDIKQAAMLAWHSLAMALPTML